MAKEIKTELRQTFENMVSNGGYVNGFHIEHILSHNDENLALFNGDAETFERERNRLGGLLLLKGNTNQAIGNEPYAIRISAYIQDLLWNATLHTDTYHANIDLRHLIERNGIALRPLEKFGPEELDERHKILAQIVELIWK